ncbi:molybdate ABC transporter substrate-binding protein [Veillonella montpellierensis]|uniref:molybdate ABC transporter substrate-binding protein n=1 Tax=Veillonella montpellierensis TaxID=187328 RepID=UPI00040C5B79|nr:molybdate ABC transporter substrate-binding protein [Veillonella montpellierensis]
MKKRIVGIIVGLFVCGLLVGCGNTNPTMGDSKNQTFANQTLTISGAASLKGALTEIADEYKKEKNLSDNQIVINFAGSGTLRQQIEQGAPASIFISADEKNMKMLEEKQLVSDVKPFVLNELVLVVPKSSKASSLQDIPTMNRFALGEVATVPAGRYGKQVLDHMNLWDTMQDKIVFAKDVKAVTAYVSQGAVDGGFIYKTDALAAKDTVTIAAETPADSHDAVVYPIALITKNTTDFAKDFYDYATGPKGKAILEKYGFTMPQ